MIQRAQIYADVKISTESDPGLKFRIFGLIWIRLSADLSMHYLVGISHFAKYGINRSLIV